jgi:hypothetical protein
MDIKQLAESLLMQQQESNAVILEIFQTGSNVFNAGRTNDNDFVVICQNYGQRKRRDFIIQDGVKYDILIMDINAVKASLDFDNTTYVYQDVKLYSYFYDIGIRKTIYGNSNLGWLMLDHKLKYINYIKNKYNSSNYHLLKDPWRVGKGFVHYYTVLKIYENNKAELTEQMLLDIKTLYGSTEAANPIIEWTIAKLKEPVESYVVEGIPPVTEEDIANGNIPFPITEPNNE